jgi:predicted nucleotide-binding protein
MEKYVVDGLPSELWSKIMGIKQDIDSYWHKEQYAKAETLLNKQYTLIRKVEEKTLPEGKRFHKGSYLHSWGMAILKQKIPSRVEEGCRKIFLAYIEDLLYYEKISDANRQTAYTSLIGNPLIKEEILELIISKVQNLKAKCQIPKDPEDILLTNMIVTEPLNFGNKIQNNLDKRKKEGKQKLSKNIFIVHGWDEKSKLELARMLEKFGFNTIILSEQPDKGKTIIEKLEQNSLDIGYVFVLLTPDDMAVTSSEPLSNAHSYRARQNVILELGYFIGKIGRDRICCLFKDHVELPSDIHGVVYSKFDKSVTECFNSIVKELKAAGYKIKL